jgi:hypothetical protein
MPERSLFLYIRLCTVTYMTGTHAWVAWKISLNSHLFGAAIWEGFVGLFLGWEGGNYQLFTVMLWSAVCAVGMLFF